MFVLQSQNSQDSAVRLGAVALWKGRSSCRLAAFRHGTSQGWILPPAFPRFSCFLCFFSRLLFSSDYQHFLTPIGILFLGCETGWLISVQLDKARNILLREKGWNYGFSVQHTYIYIYLYIYIFIFYIYIGFFLAENDCTTSTMTSLLAALVVAPTVDQFSGVFSLCYQYSLRSLLLLKIARNWWELGSLHRSNPSRQGPWPEIIFMEHEALTRL